MTAQKTLLRDIIPSLLATIVSAILITLNVFRILTIPITIDETGYPHYSYSRLLENTDGYANNHILHSVIRKFIVETFGENLFFLRFDSLVAQIVFLVFTWLICRCLFKNKWWQLCAFIVLNIISPLIFDFWGLSRGYALSLALMSVSIYYLLRYIASSRPLLLSVSFAAGILSALSNFGYVNYFVSLLGAVIIQIVIFKRTRVNISLFKELLVVFLTILAFAFVVIQPLIHVLGNGELAFLGTTGFMHDTARSLIVDGLILPDNPFRPLIIFITWSVVALTYGAGICWLFSYFKNKYYKNEAPIEAKYGITLFLLFIIPVISLIVQHTLLRINYLTDRTALFFIILFMLQFIYWLYYLKPAIKFISWGILIAIMLGAGYTFTFRNHFHYAYLWWFDMDDMNVLKKITDEFKNKPGKIKLKVYWLFTPSFNYDVKNFYDGRFYPIEDFHGAPGNDTTFDYYYIPSSEVIHMMIDEYHKDTDFVCGGFILYKKN